MEYQSLYGFYCFGTCLRYLQDARAGHPVHGDARILNNIEELFRHLDDFKLTVTARLGHSKLDPLVAELDAKAETEAPLTADEARRLNEAISTLRETLEAEIRGVGAYTTTPKRLDLHRLLNDVSPLFAPNVYAAIPVLA